MLIAHFPPSKLSHRAWPHAPRPVSAPSGRVPESSNVAPCGKDSQHRCLRSPIRKCLVRRDRGMTLSDCTRAQQESSAVAGSCFARPFADRSCWGSPDGARKSSPVAARLVPASEPAGRAGRNRPCAENLASSGRCPPQRSRTGTTAPYVLAKNPLEIDARVVETGESPSRSPADEFVVVGFDASACGRQILFLLGNGGLPRCGATASGKQTIICHFIGWWSATGGARPHALSRIWSFWSFTDPTGVSVSLSANITETPATFGISVGRWR